MQQWGDDWTEIFPMKILKNKLPQAPCTLIHFTLSYSSLLLLFSFYSTLLNHFTLIFMKLNHLIFIVLNTAVKQQISPFMLPVTFQL